MKMLKSLLVVLKLLLQFHHSLAQNFSPPSNIELKLSPPQTKEEAYKRVSDYIILNMILPPVIDRKKVAKQLFGNYYHEISEKLTPSLVQNLTKLAQNELSKPNTDIETLKNLIYENFLKEIKPPYKRNFNIRDRYIPIVLASAILSLTISIIFIFFKVLR